MVNISINCECIGCGACRSVCPTKAITLTKAKEKGNSYVATLNTDKCISCGNCVSACKHNSIAVIDDSELFFKNLEEKNSMLIIVSPEIQAMSPHWRGILKSLQDDGHRIYDVGYGTDLNLWALTQLFAENPEKKYIDVHCPAILQNLCKFHPELMAAVAPVYSPESCLGLYLKKYRQIKEPIFLLTSCTSKQYEIDTFHTYEHFVTFNHLLDYFNKKNLLVSCYNVTEFSFNNGLTGKLPFLYAEPFGFSEVCSELSLKGVSCFSQNIYDILNSYSSSEFKSRPLFLSASNCGGCSYNFGGTPSNSMLETASLLSHDIPSLKKYFKDFSKILNYEDFCFKPVAEMIPLSLPSKSQMETIFQSLHKSSAESRCIDCGLCGCKTCKDFVVSVHRKESIIEDCIPYLRSKAVKPEKSVDVANSKSVSQNEETGVSISEDTFFCITQLKVLISAFKSDLEVKHSIDLLSNAISTFENLVARGRSEGVSEDDATFKIVFMSLTILKSIDSSLSSLSSLASKSSLILSRLEELSVLLEPLVKKEDGNS